jgi:peptidoglycan glycosyltransferase
MRTGIADVRYRINVLSRIILLAFLAVAVALVYWSIGRGPGILARDDNPRLVEAELRILRGRILDANNDVLAETVGPADDLRRVYSANSTGPAVGYYSFRYGTSGVEEGLDTVLRGDGDDFWVETLDKEILHQPQVGRDVRLTLDSSWQRAAETLLGENVGGILLMTLPDASIRALASHPNYDPNVLDEEFEALVSDEMAPFFNRVTQGQYLPGLALQPFLLAAAVDRGLVSMSDKVDAAGATVTVNGSVLGCSGKPPAEATWEDVLQNACPHPMQGLGEDLRSTGLLEVFERFGLLQAPQMPIETEAAAELEIGDPALAAIGQDQLTISPLQAALALATFVTGGELPQPRLVSGIEDAEGQWQVPAGNPVSNLETTTAISAEAAESILASLPIREGIREHAALVLTGPEGSKNAWYFGLAPAGEPRYAVVVVIEGNDDLLSAQQAGRLLLDEVIGQ